MCAQQFPDGGLRDKPSKPRDFYHSCYNLGGLSAAQHLCPSASALASEGQVWGDESNRVAEVHPAFNVRASAVHAAIAHYRGSMSPSPTPPSASAAPVAGAAAGAGSGNYYPSGHATLVKLFQERAAAGK